MSQFVAPSGSIIRPRDAVEGVGILREPTRVPYEDTNAQAHRLFEVLSWKRPFDSDAEEIFARHYIDSAPGATKDAFGNRHVYVPNEDGTQCAIMWSCHIDTCHHDEGYQRLALLKDKDDIVYVGVRKGEGNCLGADDGTGVWLMLEMIAKKRPGYYLFHRGEEKGCLGSKWLKENKKDLLKNFKAAIALDRRGFDNIITHQGGERGCSEAFAASIASQIPTYKADPTGAFTDTKQYFNLIPECTNLSVGYEGQHGPLEKQYVTFALNLRKSLIAMDTRKLVIERDPTKTEYRHTTTYYPTQREWLSNIDAIGHKPIGKDHPHPDWVWSYEERCDLLKAVCSFVNGRGWVLKSKVTPKQEPIVERKPHSVTRKQEPRRLTVAEAEAKWFMMVDDSAKTLLQLVNDYPEAVTRLLAECKFNSFDILCAIHGEEDYVTFSLEEEEEAAEEEAEAEEAAIDGTTLTAAKPDKVQEEGPE